MKKLALIFALALATTPAFARAGGHGGYHGRRIHTGRSVGMHGGGMYPGGWMVQPIYLRIRRLCSTNKYRHGLKLLRL